ncbi:phosphoenolpyruvate--protein phosphotransferase [Marinicellulosiphila megalodicopiae]|uniref:phosphoenolpyruvate--protein phosphotransferase n=1 Tax=Marinicellulosiphila megalodicopiae TaxID=2724896 RepID=UPI003BB001F4
MLTILRKIIQEVSNAGNLDAILHLITSRVKQNLEVDVCSLFLFDFEERRYVLMSTDGLNKRAIGQVSLGETEGIVGLAGSREEPINLEDAQNHAEFHYLPGLGEDKFKSMLAVPIIHQRKVLGVLVIQNIDTRKFNESEEAFLVTLSAQIAGTIAQAEASGVVEGKHFSGQIAFNSRFDGVRGASGIAVGIAYVCTPSADLKSVSLTKAITDIDTEEQAFMKALDAVREDISKAGERLADALRPEERALFDVYLGMLEDHALGGEVVKRIREGNWAQGSLCEVIKGYEQHFNEMEDAYLRERASDIRDLGQRVLSHLQKNHSAPTEIPYGAVVIGEEVNPSMLGEFQARNVVALVSMQGSANSHIAILSRAMGIPTVMGAVDLPLRALEGKELVVDGYSGHVYANLTDEKRNLFLQLVEDEKLLVKGLENLKDKPAITTDNHKMSLVVNTGLMSDVVRSQDLGAEGVGLYRTEVPFMTFGRFPSEIEQAEIYRQQLSIFAPHPVTMRTLDIGGDKSLPYLPIVEDNPFLGWRGIRITLDHPEVFLVQLRAMLRASEGLNNLKIMLPMITSISELQTAKYLIHRSINELREDGLEIVEPEIGVMIEVPAAVYQAHHLAKECDFLSVGSNDLTQYILAVDRNNPRVAELYSSLHPAVLMSFKHIIDQAKLTNTPVSVCGEIAGDPVGAILLMGMGYQKLSMNAASLLKIKAVIRETSLTFAQQLVEKVMKVDDESIVQAIVKAELKRSGMNLKHFGIRDSN